MIRFLISVVIKLLANAVGLFLASVILSGFTISGFAFIVAVCIFTLVELILDPLITKIATDNIPALRGGVALVTTFVGLIITSLLSDGLSISGASTWLLATLIVWLCALLASIILPLFIFKKARENRNEK